MKAKLQAVSRISSRGVLLFMVLVLSASFVVTSRGSAFFTGGCIASIAPPNINVASSSDFIVTVTNANPSDLLWVEITIPASNYYYVGGIAESPWEVTDNNNGASFSGGEINSQWSEDFQIVVGVGLQNAGPQTWTVRASTNAGGSNPMTCTGNPSTSITGTAPQDASNGVSDVAATNITQQSATVTWHSDFPTTSLVYYGKTSNYSNSSAYNSTYTQDHSITLTGLAANTTYHFQVIGTDGQGSYAYSMDNTFVTASSSTTPAQPATPAKPGTASPGSPTVPGARPAIPGQDTTSPQLTLKTKLDVPYKSAPVIAGEATDNQSVVGVEYSMDGGKNWLPIDSSSGISSSKVIFDFKPSAMADGNYSIMVRAFDSSGNATATAPQVLVIDTLPPVVGGTLTSLGTLTVKPDDQGVMHAPVGVDQRITVSAVGGPTNIVVDAERTDDAKTVQSFSFTYIADVGLWTGALNFQKPGTYRLSVRALDGAGNRTERSLGSLVVDPLASVVDAKTNKQVPADVTVYYRDPETNSWVLWDGSAYAQNNPVKTGVNGQYGLYLPGGTYYLKASSAGYSDTVSKIFTLREPTAISTTLPMHRKPGIHVGSIGVEFPWPNFQQVDITVQRTSKAITSPAVSKPLPNFALSVTDGSVLSPSKMYGKPTVITFVSTWSQPAQDQLAVLSSVDRKSVNIVAVASGESQARLAAYQKIAGLSLPIVADNKNSLISDLGISSLPTTLFVDRHGVVKKVMVGVLSKKEIIDYVSSGL